MSKSIDFDDVLIRPVLSDVNSREDVNLISTMQIKGETLESAGIIASNMDTVGTISMAHEFSKHKCHVALHKFYEENKYIEWAEQQLFKEHFFTCGLREDIKILKNIVKVANHNGYKPLVHLDVANGYINKFHELVSEVSQMDCIVMAGSVCTYEGAQKLWRCGADIVKCQIGPGKFCKTRKITGIGNGTISTILECNEDKPIEKYLCSDGGIREPGDICKAFVAGANFVMIGSMFAGTDESEGEWMTDNGQSKLVVHGMSSDRAMNKYYGGVASYRTSEGIEGFEVHKGPVSNILNKIFGGIRSCCTYTSCSDRSQLDNGVDFIYVGG